MPRTTATPLTPHQRHRREATRLDSCAQIGADAHLACQPDPALRGSVIASADFLTRIQRRIGLYVSCLQSALDERVARGLAVTQHDRLATRTSRCGASREAAQRCARRHCGGTPRNEPTGTILQGDKGDGTTASRAEAAQRYKFLNDGHIPDLYRLALARHLGAQMPHALLPQRRARPWLGEVWRRCLDDGRPLLRVLA